MTNVKKKTVGQAVTELAQAPAQAPTSVIGLQQAMQEDYIKNLEQCVNDNLPKYNKDFFVVVITKKEPKLKDVYRNYFFARASCPSPDYDQAVYRYDYKQGELEYIWVVPSKDACLLYLENQAFVEPEEFPIMEMVLKFADGTLYSLAKQLNGEAPDSNLLIN